MQDYQLYENVLTTAKTINEQKQTLAQQNDKNAAIALKELQPVVKATLHHDSTTRSKIDGDWPALILIFSDCCRFPLQTMFFAYEDRKQITRLIIETTDSVSKNLKVNELVAEASQFNHKPDHLLCKSHVVEAFDHYNLDMLATVEN